MGLASIIATGALREATKPAVSLIKRKGFDAYHSMMVEYAKSFATHMDLSYDRCSKVKNILYRDHSVTLESQYVNVRFTQGPLKKSDNDIVSGVLLGDKILVSGTAGAGKTMFMKWSVTKIIDNFDHHQIIPLFLELRYIAEDDLDKGLPQLLHKLTSKSEGKVSFELFNTGLEAGSFVVILDAIDEVRQDAREKAIRAIRTFISDFPDCPILMSTRPDDSLEAMQEIGVIHSVDMELEQIVSVIEKLQFDNTVKGRLIEKLRNGLFTEHKEFLSNPLLATIMLLTFDHAADIPSKITSFYKQAFEALYQRHDAAKGAYRRGHHAGLPLDEYERIFSLFCFDSYVDSKVSFGDAEILEYFKEAALFHQINVPATLLVRDAMESICVIQREGLENVFVHRSFQEYFAALFLSRYDGEDFANQIENVNRTDNERNILAMLMELAPEKLEEKWVLPKLAPLVAKIRNVKSNTKTGTFKIITEIYNTIGINVKSGKITSFGVHRKGNKNGRAGTWLNSIEAAYAESFPLAKAIFSEEAISDEFEKYLDFHYPKNIETWQDRLEFQPKSSELSEEAVIRVNEKDVEWLLESAFAQRLGKVRDAIVRLHDDIIERMENRKNIMKRISVRRP